MAFSLVLKRIQSSLRGLSSVDPGKTQKHDMYGSIYVVVFQTVTYGL